jgi:hypothetical protein
MGVYIFFIVVLNTTQVRKNRQKACLIDIKQTQIPHRRYVIKIDKYGSLNDDDRENKEQ